MIHIKIDDTIVDIVDKMELEKSEEIILDFPLWHPILHNYISLKILKSKANNKKLIIATSDKIWKKIGKQIGIEYSVIKNKGFIENTSSKSLLGHNYTFWEYLKFQISSYKSEFFHNIQSHKKLHTLWKYWRASYEKIWVTLFMAWLIVSIIIFLFIYYFAINKSYIEIKPEIIIKKEAHNFVFTQNIPETVLWNNRYVKIDQVTQTIYSSEIYAATQILENNNISTWEVIIYNNLTQEQTLVPNTRFMTDDGIIFRTQEWVKIPAAVIDNFWNATPGTATIDVRSEVRDANWTFIWERGNIQKDTDLIIPGLDTEIQTEIYWKANVDFTGWNNDFQKIISQEDIDRAKELFTRKLENEVIVLIKNNILSNNKENNTSIDILPGTRSIDYSNLEINIEPWVEAWVLKDSFKLEWNITANVYTYNKENVIQRLKILLNEKKLDWVEKINYINENSLRMSEVIYIESSPFEMKSTFEMEAIYVHDFLHKNNSFTDSLKQHIRWMPKDEARSYLLNNSKISNVEITLRPFFLENVSNIYNNIVFNIE